MSVGSFIFRACILSVLAVAFCLIPPRGTQEYTLFDNNTSISLVRNITADMMWGVYFQVEDPSYVRRLRTMSPKGNKGIRTGYLWREDVLLTMLDFAPATGKDEWLEVELPHTVHLMPGQTYSVGYSGGSIVAIDTNVYKEQDTWPFRLFAKEKSGVLLVDGTSQPIESGQHAYADIVVVPVVVRGSKQQEECMDQ